MESRAAAEVDAPQVEDRKEEEVRAEVSVSYFLTTCHTVFIIIIVTKLHTQTLLYHMAVLPSPATQLVDLTVLH